MNRKPKRLATDKVIHIRLGEETHQKLKMYVASSRAAIQQLVESLIRAKYLNMQVKVVKP